MHHAIEAQDLVAETPQGIESDERVPPCLQVLDRRRQDVRFQRGMVIGIEPQCMSTISPGCRLPQHPVHDRADADPARGPFPPEVPSHPRVSTVHPTGTNPAPFTTEIVCWL